jgi:hypothetical protein
MVVGEPGSELVQTTVRLAREWELDARAYDNVYGATVGLARANGRRVLVLGRIQDLAGHNGAFFRIAVGHAARCCCLLDPSPPAGREDLLAALRTGVTMAGDVQEVGSILREWLTAASSLPNDSWLGARDTSHEPRATGHERRLADDWRATEAELSALLE